LNGWIVLYINFHVSLFKVKNFDYPLFGENFKKRTQDFGNF
jgi:hypothetical protein